MNQRKGKSAVSPKPPRIPKVLDTNGLPDGTLQDHGIYSNIAIVGTHLNHLEASDITIDKATMSKVELRDSQLEYLRIRDVIATDCDFANAAWPGVSLRWMEMHTCRLTGLRANEAHMQDILFEGCICRFAQFRFSTFKAARFENCDFSGADFQGADMTEAVFHNCNLDNAEMSQVKLAGADIRGCKTDGLHVGVEELRGAIIDPAQAVTLVRSLGIEVDWPDETTARPQT